MLAYKARHFSLCLFGASSANFETDLDKARGGGSSFGGSGSIFGRSTSTSIPPELASLATPQQNVSRLLLSTKSATSTADQDYDKLMAPDATVPSAPVYAARLNGLLKTLAQAEGAVDLCVKARQALVGELQKILDTNKASLASDEEQLANLRKRKIEVDDKKRDVEFAIMQGLPNDDPSPSNGLSAHPDPEPEPPEIEALTPPPNEPEISEEAEQSRTPQFSPIVPQEATFQSTPAPGIEILSNLAAQYKSVPSGTNGSSKKRRLDDGDDFPDLGGDDGIDADVAEMLRKDSTSGP